MHTEALARLLDRAPVPALADLAAGHPARVALVGGAVRDTLLGREPADLDLIVEEDLEGFLAAVESLRGRGASAIGDHFQDTHRMRWSGVQVDVARSRGSVEEDLGRRDFSINAMAVELPASRRADPPVLDPYGGLRDLESRVVRETSPGVLAADPLRVLRALRTVIALPGFALHPETRRTIRTVAPMLPDVAAERRVDEWLGILGLPGWHAGLELAGELGIELLGLGAVAKLEAVRAWMAAEGAGGARVSSRLAALLRDLIGDGDLEAAGERLVEQRWPRRMVRRAVRTARWSRDGTPDGETLARWALEDSMAATDAAALAASLASRCDSREAAWAERLERFAQRAREPRWVRGRDLLAIGFAPGPRVGELVRTAAMGQVTRRWPDRDAALEWAREGRPGGTS